MRNRWTLKAGSCLSAIHARLENTIKAFSKNIKPLAIILIAVAILSSISQMNAWADVVAQPG